MLRRFELSKEESMYEWGVTIEWLTPVGATNGPLFEDSWPVV